MGHGQVIICYNGSEIFCSSMEARSGESFDMSFEKKSNNISIEIIDDEDNIRCGCSNEYCICNCIGNGVLNRCTNIQCVHYETKYERECINLIKYYNDELDTIDTIEFVRCICLTDLIRMVNNNVNEYLIDDMTNIVISYIIPYTFWPHKRYIIMYPEIWITTEDKLKYNEDNQYSANRRRRLHRNYTLIRASNGNNVIYNYREDFVNSIKKCRIFLKKHTRNYPLLNEFGDQYICN